MQKPGPPSTQTTNATLPAANLSSSKTDLSRHAGHLRGTQLPGDDILPEVRVLQIPQVGHTAPNPLLVFVPHILELTVDSYAHTHTHLAVKANTITPEAQKEKQTRKFLELLVE